MIAKEDPETHGAMFVPVILGSDKTTVSVATGQNEYYPLYAGIGNVQNHVRRAYRNAIALIGFLAIPKSMYSLFESVPAVSTKCGSLKSKQPISSIKIAPSSAGFVVSCSTRL
jgi:hypothetical protein